eukprot:CAMPEP_0170488696 /NCGR_PEP_ID=MMETSP0208-20121228/7172_1 /TAXON_ID=197538 /ORGANISM="Strombidium inclinatum, Strain S3" /LENGTH=114 /DNA_ID=CAMNT_0010763333 /DNA_START=805 /DNA_END=1149 /DNA_ORIENTATION=-
MVIIVTDHEVSYESIGNLPPMLDFFCEVFFDDVAEGLDQDFSKEVEVLGFQAILDMVLAQFLEVLLHDLKRVKVLYNSAEDMDSFGPLHVLASSELEELLEMGSPTEENLKYYF